MKLHYHADTDSLYIALSPTPSADSDEMAEGIVLDFDANGRLVGIDIDNASRKLDLHELKTEHIPIPASAACPAHLSSFAARARRRGWLCSRQAMKRTPSLQLI